MRSTAIAEAALSSEFRALLVRNGITAIREFEDPTLLGQRIGQVLQRYVARTSESRQQISGNTTRGWKLGPLAHRLLHTTLEELQVPDSTSRTGLVGEYAVMSELFACDWNVAKLPYDDGIDLLARKADEIRTVQVKTVHPTCTTPETFQVQIPTAAHTAHNSVRHYYVIVLRRNHGFRRINDFLILSPADFRRLQSRDDVRGGEDSTAWRFTIVIANGRYKVGDSDLTENVNRWRSVFV